MFIFDATEFSVALPTDPGNSFQRMNLGAGSPASIVTVDISAAVRDGDLVFGFFGSASQRAGNPWSVPSGWTQTVPQQNSLGMGGPVIGQNSLIHKVWRNGDPLTVTSTLAITESAVVGGTMIVRASSDGSTLLIGNPPSSGFTTGYATVQNFNSSTHVAQPFRVDSSPYDLRILFLHSLVSNTGHQFTPPAVTPSAANPYGRPMRRGFWGQGGGNIFTAWGLWADPSGTEVATSSWVYNDSFSSTAGAMYSVSVVVHDPNASDPMLVGEEAKPEEAAVALDAAGLEHLSTITQAGGGGNIIVF